ncbi:hypothetical protein [Vibrio japonicus]|uniref:hypothetical protein n=1 Tax=Vibrio japonicus TaxID=1824638 RepID=UPI0035256577
MVDFGNVSQALTLAGGLSLGVLIVYFLLRLNFLKRYSFTLSEKGFISKQRSTLPKWFNTAAQVMGWFGAIVCVFMVAVAGPMALAGAGGFILLSFGMLKRQPDEPTEIKVGMREDWLFAYYNKKRKVIQFFYKHDKCYYRDIYKTTIFRSHSRGDSYIFFKTVTDLEAMIEKLSNDYHLECIEVEDHKEIFKGKPEPKLADIPVRNLEYPIDDTFELRAKKRRHQNGNTFTAVNGGPKPRLKN